MRNDVLPPFPMGWYAVCELAELQAGGTWTGMWCGREVVAWRTASGQAVLSEAYCPHMGAHLGCGGEVRGEELVCPFHAFRFDAQGVCTATPYGPPPPAARLKGIPCGERFGALFAWHDGQGGEPRFPLPTLDEEGWTPFRFHVFDRLATHPQETSENSVDVGHFSTVHRYLDVTTLAPLEVDGPRLTARYGITREVPLGLARPSFRVEFTARLFGLGLSIVETELPASGLRMRQLVLSTPTEAGRVTLRVAASVARVQPGRITPALALVPSGLATLVLHRAMMAGFVQDVTMDRVIWENKTYLHPAALARGDGPIGRYRAWAEQFYAD